MLKPRIEDDMTHRMTEPDGAERPDAPHVGVKDEGETDAEFIDRMAGDGWSNRRLGDRDRLVSLARRAALVPEVLVAEAMARAAPGDPTPVPSDAAAGGTSVEAFGFLKIVDDWAYRWICDRSFQASGDPNFIHGYQRGASHVAIELRKLVIEHMPDFHQRVAAEQARAALRSDQGER